MKKIREAVYEIPKQGEMRVPTRVYGNQAVLKNLEQGAYSQMMNVATLPGIQKYSIMLPDAHFGYGFSIGGVAAFDLENGIISPGGVGYDINCSVRSVMTNLTEEQVRPKLKELVQKLFRNVPSGVGSEGRLRVSKQELRDVLVQGAEWAVEKGYGSKSDLEKIEENGKMSGADPSKVSERAIKRGTPQLGTLGSGNHFLEIQRVSDVFDSKVAEKLGVREKNQIGVMIHCGSRGLGYQVCDDYIRILDHAVKKYKIRLPDRQLVCAPLGSPEADDYLSAMFCAVNYAFCNKQVISHWVKETLMDVFKISEEELGYNLVYEVCHNIAKFEKHEIDGENKTVCVHRKGATRAFPPGRPEVPSVYRETGQPVLIPGDMGTASYILLGTETALKETFGSTVHGAGRVMSRSQAKRTYRGEKIREMLEKKGQVVQATSPMVLAEEAPGVYKDVDQVIRSVEEAGISKKIVRLEPLGVAKG